jgi:hypothetical protein
MVGDIDDFEAISFEFRRLREHISLSPTGKLSADQREVLGSGRLGECSNRIIVNGLRVYDLEVPTPKTV